MAFGVIGLLLLGLILLVVIFGLTMIVRGLGGVRLGHATLDCPRCGQPTRADLATCTHCGNPLR